MQRKISERGLYYYIPEDEEPERRSILKNRLSGMALFFFVLILLPVLAFNFGLPELKYITPEIFSDTPQPSGEASDVIDTSKDPLQTSASASPVQRKISGDVFTIVPVADYEIYAAVKSSKWYSDLLGFENDRKYAKIAPVDLCLAWGKFAEPEYESRMKFTQGKRNCEWRSVGGIETTESYTISHVSNNHIIPATKNIVNAIKSMKTGDKIVLKGYLVDVLIEINGKNYTFLKTSLIREDWGLEGCEVFYVDNVRIGNMIYE